MAGSGAGAAALTCQAYKTLTTGTESNGQACGLDANNFQTGQGAWSPDSGTVQVCRVDVYPVEVGDVTGVTYYARIFTMAASPATTLDSLISNGQSSGITVGATIDSPLTFTWTGSYPELTAGTSYGITIRRCDTSACDDTTVDASNYIFLRRILSSDLTGYHMSWKTNKSFYLGSSSYECKIVIYTMQ